MPHDRPNILWLVTDQQRHDSLGCYGSAAVPTPRLDALAAGGVRFDRCYCNNPVCTPSRASMLTGHAPPRHGVRAIDDRLDDRHELLPHRLRALGYHTGLVGKLHVQAGGVECRGRHPKDGFDVYDLYYGGGAMMDSPLNAYAPWLADRDPAVLARLRALGKNAGPIPPHAHMTTWAAERTVAFLDARPADRPFFCMASVFDPHNPYDDHPPEAEARVGLLPEPIPAEPDDALPEALRRERHDNYFADFSTLSPADLRRMRLGYFASIGLIDDAYGRILDALDARGLAENTLVVFTSDHGDLLGDHGLMVKGAAPYEANVHVPLIARWPGRLPAGTASDQLVQLNDLAALSLAAAGGDAADLPDAVDPLAGRRDVVISDYRNSGLARGHVPFDPPIDLTVAFDGRHKLALYHGPHGDAGQLFDLRDDPRERRDRYADDAPDLAEPRRRLAAAIDDYRARERATACGDPNPPPTPEDSR